MLVLLTYKCQWWLLKVVMEVLPNAASLGVFLIVFWVSFKLALPEETSSHKYSNIIAYVVSR